MTHRIVKTRFHKSRSTLTIQQAHSLTRYSVGHIMPLKVRIHPISTEHDPVIAVSTASIASTKNVASESKPRQRSRGATFPTADKSFSSHLASNTGTSRIKVSRPEPSQTANNEHSQSSITSIRYQVAPVTHNCDIPITEEFAPSALENESDDGDEHTVHRNILLFLIAPLWCILKAIYLFVRFDKHNDHNGQARGRSIKFILMLIFLSVIAYFMLADNIGRGNHKVSTDHVRLPLLPKVRKPYVEEAKRLKRELRELTLQATKKILSHPYELVRYGVSVEVNVNYNWKQPHCNKKQIIFKNEVCAARKLKKDGRCKRQHDNFNRTVER